MKRKERGIKIGFMMLALIILTLCSNALLKAEEIESAPPNITFKQMESGVDYDFKASKSYNNNGTVYYSGDAQITFKLNNMNNDEDDNTPEYKYNYYLVSVTAITDDTDVGLYHQFNADSVIALSSGINYIRMAKLTKTTTGEGDKQTTSYQIDTLSDILEFRVDKMGPQLTFEYEQQWKKMKVHCEEAGSGVKEVYYSTSNISNPNWKDFATKLDFSPEMEIPLIETGNLITYYFMTEDNLGNSNNFSRTFVNGIDWTMPSYKETYLTPAQEVDDIYYYNASAKGKQFLEATFTDNIDLPSESWGKFKVKEGSNEGATQAISENIGKSQTFIVTLPETAGDGMYQFEGTAEDKLENKLEYTSKKMVYDTKAPVIDKYRIKTCQYNENDENKDTVSIYNEPLEFEVEVIDKNPDKLEVFYNNEKLKEDTDYTVEEQEASANSTCKYTITLLKNVRNAKLSVSAIDKAKNESASQTVIENMILDTLEPQIVKGSVCINDIPLIYENKKERPVFHPVNNLLTFTIEDEDNFQMDNLKVQLLNDKGDPVNNREIKVKDKIVDNKTIKIEAKGLLFNEGEYSLQITYTDGAHDVNVCTTGKFLIDGVPPRLEFSTGVSKKYTVGENAAKAQVVDLEISDNNIANNLAEEKVFTWNLEVTDARGNAINNLHCFINDVEKTDITPEELADYLGTLDNWQNTKTANTYRTHIEFVTEGNYQIKDAFAHDSIYRSDNKDNASRFTIDGTNPYFRADGGGVTFAKKNSQQILKETPYSDFQYITKEDVEVTLIVEDEISDIKKVILSYTADGEKAEKNVEASADKQSEGKYVFYIPDVEKSFKATIHHISITDACGNTRVHAINRGVIVDKEKQVFELMQVTIQDNNADNKKVIYNKDINLLLSAKDTWSGLQTVTYELNQTEKNQTFTGGDVVYDWNSGEGKIVLKAVPENEGESIPVTLKATDNAGNEQKISKNYMIDITKPEISLSFEDNESSAYFNHDRTAVITIKDKHIDTKDITVMVMKNGEEIAVKPVFKTTDNETYTAKVSFGKEGKKFAEDGDYQIFVGCKDLAGNVADMVKSKKFTIDQTSPVIRISFDNNNARNGNYYSSQRTATITVEEHNFDAALLNLDIQGTLDGADIHVPSVSEFSSEGDVHTAQVDFKADGDYIITGSITDAAGNISNSMTRDEFTIDLETPVVKITGVNSGESYNDVVQPLIEVQDINFNSSDVSIVLQGSKTGTKELKYDKTETEKTGSYRYEDFPHVEENDDYYTLKIQVTDMAGNQYQEEMGFKVNRFGSTYVLDDYTKAAVDTYYTNIANDFIIMEENVNEIVESQLYYSKDGDITYLEKDKDYTVSHDVNRENWNVYRYAIKSETITTDGIYSFTIYSKDEIGNEMDNKSKELKLEVCIDKTKPVCTIIGVENQGVYEEERRDICIEVYDNILLDKVDIYMNGKRETYPADKIVDDKINIQYSESTKAQTLRVICYDKAGNVYDTDDDGGISFTLTTNVLTTALSKVAGNPLPWILLAITGVGAIIFFIVVVKKKEEGK